MRRSSSLSTRPIPVEKDKILEFIDTYRKLFQFAEIIPCSALRQKNTDDIVPSIFKYLPYGPQLYDEDTRRRAGDAQDP